MLKALIVGVVSALVLVGCSPTPAGNDAAAAPGGSTEKRLAELEKSVGTLQAQNTDLRAKLRSQNVFSGRSPLGDFFAAPEFWECTYDSSWSDCSSRCSKNTANRNKECLKLPEGAERVACVEKAAADGAACLKACPVQTSPIGPPACAGGIGGPA